MARAIDELIAEIQSHHQALDSLAEEAEQTGNAPEALVDIMRELHLPMVKVPKEVGGDELGLADQLRYFAALAYANPTAAWVGFNHAGAGSIAAARLPEAGLAEVFGDDATPFFAGVAAPSGRLERTEDGGILNGTWRFASGCNHASWAAVTALEKSDQPMPLMCVISRDDFTLNGDWDVMALKGTGSINIVCENVHVPTHRLLNPFQPPLRGGPIYSIPVGVYVAGENLGFTLGVTERFLDEAIAYAKTKSNMFGKALASRGAFQYEIGKAQTQINSVRALAINTLGEAQTSCAANGQLAPVEEQKVLAMLAYGTELCAQVTSHIYHFLGASTLFEKNILQRCFRDIHGSAQHAIASNEAYDRFGATLLEA
ncbi:MAG: acyl-CoA dehydrogenase family protein [Pseudomonadota bacterium]